MKLLSLVERKKEKTIKQYIVDNKEALYRFAYTYVHNEDDALDVVHDAICKSLTNINTLKDTDSIKPWIYRIVANCAIDNIRKNKKYVISSDDLEVEKYRTIIVLRYFEDMKIGDIAQILDENENTIKTRLYNALAKLKISISE